MKKKKTLKLTMSRINKFIACGIALLILSSFPLSSFAQDLGRSEFSIYGGGGISTFLHDSQPLDKKLGFGGLVGLGYGFSFTPKWSINTGAELALYNSKLTTSSLVTSSRPFDGSYFFDYVVTHNSFEEKQQATYLQIPLTLQFQSAGKTKFYASAGVKYGLSLDGKFDMKASSFSSIAQTITANQPAPNATLASGSDVKKSGKLLLDQDAWLGTFETGVKWPVGQKLSLYTGAYIDYSFVNPVNLEQLQPVLEYKTNERNSVVNSPTFAGVNTNLFAVGIKLRLALHSGRRQAAPAPAPAPPPPPPPAPAPAPAPAPPPPPPPAPAPAPAQPTASELATLNAAIECFAFDKSDIPSGAIELLDNKAQILNKYPNIAITVTGHTDNVGADDYNVELGRRRAEAVKAYLVSKGVNASRITVDTKGKAAPVVPNDSAANRCKNRRVDFIVR